MASGASRRGIRRSTLLDAPSAANPSSTTIASITASGLRMKGAEKEFSDAGGATHISTVAPRWSHEGLPIDSGMVMTVSSRVEGSWKSRALRSSLGVNTPAGDQAIHALFITFAEIVIPQRGLWHLHAG